MRLRRPQSAGFTLMELVLVMLIIAVAMAMVAPSLSGFVGSQGAKNTVTELVSLTQWARSASITQGKIHRLTVDANARTYYLAVEQDDGSFGPLGTSLGTVLNMSEGTQVTLTRQDGSPDTYVDFYPNGRLVPATIRITDKRGEETVIQSLSPTEPFQVANKDAQGR